jgi:hypothetical protein
MVIVLLRAGTVSHAQSGQSSVITTDCRGWATGRGRRVPPVVKDLELGSDY